MAKVNTPEKAATQALPKSSKASDPANAAPAVWATVFSVRMAAIGLSMWLLSSCRRRPERRPSARRSST